MKHPNLALHVCQILAGATEPCTSCNGTGLDHYDACRTCGGSGLRLNEGFVIFEALDVAKRVCKENGVKPITP